LNHDSGYDIESTASSSLPSVDNNSIENYRYQNVGNVNHTEFESNAPKKRTSLSVTNSIYNQSGVRGSQTEQLKNELDEVEALTSRVRDSISIDLSNTRRYSPLLYEYYRQQLELARSIQSTYNIQCNTLFDAMTLMKRCLKDYSQTVHNPEYFAIDTLKGIDRMDHPNDSQINAISNSSTMNFDEYFSNDVKSPTKNHQSFNGVHSNSTSILNYSISATNRHFKKLFSGNPFAQRSKSDLNKNQLFSSPSSKSSSLSSATTTTAAASTSSSLNATQSTIVETKLSINKTQTYV
jgi:hypothetical protein